MVCLIFLDYIIRWDGNISNPLPIHPEFNWIAEIGVINNREMHRTFNMGMGMVLAVSSNNAQKIVDWLDERLPGTKIVGSVNDEWQKSNSY